MNHYETLGVNPSATPEDIKKAFKAKAKKVHPDAGGNTQEFQKIQRAYQVLEDPTKKAQYDQFGEAGEQSIERQAEANLTQMFVQALESGNIARLDIVEEVRNSIFQGLKKFEEKSKRAHEKADKFRDAIKRLKKKSPGNSFLTAAIEAQIEACINQSKACAFEMEKGEKMVEMIDDYEWVVDKEPEPSPWSSYGFGGIKMPNY